MVVYEGNVYVSVGELWTLMTYDMQKNDKSAYCRVTAGCIPTVLYCTAECASGATAYDVVMVDSATSTYRVC